LSRGATASGAPKPRTGGGPNPRSGGGPKPRTGGGPKPRSGGGPKPRSGGGPKARATSDRRGLYEQPRTKRKGSPSGRGRPERAGKKRTSRSTDERNPTRSSIDYPKPKYRQRGESEAAPTPQARPSLRKVQRGRDAPKPVNKAKRVRKTAPVRRRPYRATEATEELRQLAGRRATGAVRDLNRAAEAVRAGHELDALRILRPLRDQYPEAAAVRELLGLCHYRLGQFPAAAKELGAFADLTGSVEQHPVLMDCARAQRKWAQVNRLWDELAAASPSAALVAEGRIVMAGSLADRGRLREAIALLDRRGNQVQHPAEHHLRVWYVLADLNERAGDLPRARELFDRVRRADPSFADVAERLLALG
jgi:predicted Zn-dependent protease